MSTTSFGVNDAMAKKLWAKQTITAERDTLEIEPLIGEDENSIIQEKTDTAKEGGDKITFSLRTRLAQKGITEGQKAIGNAEALTHYSDSVIINELGANVGVKSKNTIDTQRVPFNLREQAKDGLVEWWTERKTVSFFNQVCGYTPANTEGATSGAVYTGFNTVSAPTATRLVRAAAAASDQAITSNDTFTLQLIDKAVEMASTGNNIVRPLKGEHKYVVYLDPAQVTSLRTNTATGSWVDYAKQAMAGGKIKDNPLYTGAIGEYNSCILRKSQDVSQGVNGSTGAAISTVRRAVLLGCQAAMLAYGNSKSGGTTYRWSEEMLDHDRELEVSAWAMWGMKKTVFNSVDFGTITIASYAARAS
ncbi:MAG: N4-gp56 family major capsid protein [Hyphomicrobiaceae bacterium]|nr:N4-gp56 family major capsid protein [Hyphomicrobiaceae bacterium]